MKTTRYILTKYETIRRTEKVKYTIKIPENARNKITYAEEQLAEGNYLSCEVKDIVDSEMLDEEIISLKKAKPRTKSSHNTG